MFITTEMEEDDHERGLSYSYLWYCSCSQICPLISMEYKLSSPIISKQLAEGTDIRVFYIVIWNYIMLMLNQVKLNKHKFIFFILER